MIFNAVFGPKATQDEFFVQSGILDLLQMSLDGYSITIFAFGQVNFHTNPRLDLERHLQSLDQVIIQLLITLGLFLGPFNTCLTKSMRRKIKSDFNAHI